VKDEDEDGYPGTQGLFWVGFKGQVNCWHAVSM
jgi:hypothetical protein